MAEGKIYALPHNYSGNPFGTIGHGEGDENFGITFHMSSVPEDPPSGNGVQTITLTLEDTFTTDGVESSDKIFALPQSLHTFPILDLNSSLGQSEPAEELGASAPSAPPLLQSDEASAPPIQDAVFSGELKSKLEAYFPGKSMQKFQFHKSTTGINIQFDAAFEETSRIDYEDDQAYIFSSKPLKEMETVVVQVTKISDGFQKSLTFGVTSADINKLNKSDLPKSHEDLVDKPDYWVFKQNINDRPVVGDILAFTLVRDGRIMFQRNDEEPALLMHVDSSVKLWMFIDVMGQITALKSIGYFTASNFKKLPNQVLQKSKSIDDSNSCVVCMDRPKQIATIPCGHYSMCEECHPQITSTTNRCPLCQGKIRSIQRIFN
ncbi:Protein neuralized [Nymphon striatum]|nr:Protein neuralized [Nymphon striatum]